MISTHSNCNINFGILTLVDFNPSLIVGKIIDTFFASSYAIQSMFLKEEVEIIDSGMLPLAFCTFLKLSIEQSSYHVCNKISKYFYTEIKVFLSKCSNAIINH